MCMDHDPSSLWTKSQGHMSRSRVRTDDAFLLSRYLARGNSGETCGVVRRRPTAAAESSVCGRGTAGGRFDLDLRSMIVFLWSISAE